ncbi:3-hydroxyisobutyrate dehydrogenase [Polynucleobacter sp. MWH-Braz-FAM2G]|uniref:3-hydroxyisobutyrate dehydrogenase n=1 Tax=Polynucleobacter sp. MWH-Braz-FAM2G TaxID=1855883 RepID=UPI001BFE54BF|nr:3-hydroxyisobutyrate dehydrogenase [Polynucleobacter sp. MWH-Braz-FAM2G]QWD90223.1 3-hydroxyisobutyrate dehydrogenase [Polynucleobacter sp. MWH-Braz-FAM2G]
MKIGFIGLGNMGAPMARNLIKAGHDLTVFDLSADALAQLRDAGAQVSKSVAEIANSANMEVIITMLPASQHVKSVYLNQDGILKSVAKGVLLIDCSTIDPQTAREVAKAAKDQGNTMLDAPVSGGTGGAEAGTLTFMVGGEKEGFDRAQPLLAKMGKNIVHCGGSGNGQVAKVANNMLLGISMIATAEAMSLGVSLGMDPKVLAGIINTSSGRCWSSEIYNPYPGVVETAPASRGYTGGFGVDLMLKDLGLATEAAKFAKQPVVLGAVAQQLYQLFSSQGSGKLDFSAIINLHKN